MRQNKENRIISLFQRKAKLQPVVDFFIQPEIANLFNQVESDIILAIKQVAVEDNIKREALFYDLRAIERVKQKIMHAFNEIKTINHNIEAEDGRSK